MIIGAFVINTNGGPGQARINGGPGGPWSPGLVVRIYFGVLDLSITFFVTGYNSKSSTKKFNEYSARKKACKL